MFTLALLPILALPQGPEPPQETRQVIEMTADGLRLVRQVRPAAATGAGNASGRSYGRTMRWAADDDGQGWIADDVEVGDHGALVLAGMRLNSDGYRLFPGGDAQHYFDVRSDSQSTKVGAADYAATCAAMSVYSSPAAGGGYDLEPVLEVYHEGGSLPAWSASFPIGAGYYSDGHGARVSDDGEVIFAWFGYPFSGTVKTKAFTKDGALISERGFGVVNGAAIPQEVQLSDDGALAMLQVSDQIKLYEVHSRQVLLREEMRDYGLYCMFSGSDLSGDGSTFAFGGYGMVQVFRETSPGVWARTAELTFDSADFCGPLALSQDGSRIGYVVQEGTADSFEIRLHDLSAGAELFRHAVSAPGTSLQLWASELDLDDAGETVAVASWGDSFHQTPEGIVLDAAGNVASEYWMDGSAFHVDLDPTGQVVAFGTKDAHANHFGHGGDVLCADTRPADLRVLGFPARGAMLDVEVAATGDWAVIVAAEGLGASPTPYGVSQLDLGTTLLRTPPQPIPPLGLSEQVQLPWTPQLSSRLLHFQAAIGHGGTGHLSNRVSLHLLP